MSNARNEYIHLKMDDFAISFQEKEGVQEVWKFICYIVGNYFDEDIDESEEDDEDTLPEPSLKNLAYIAIKKRIQISILERKGIFYHKKDEDYFSEDASH